MKFRKKPNGQDECVWQIKVNNRWYILCACINCKNVAAFFTPGSLELVDNKVKCCKNPDYYVGYDGAKEIVTKFKNKLK